MKLKFPFDAVVDGEVIYKKGEVYDVPEKNNSAMRWIKRGAEVVEDEAAPVAESKPEKFEDPEVKEKGVTQHVRRSQKRQDSKGAKEEQKEEVKVETKAEEPKTEEVSGDEALNALGGDDKE